MTADERSADHTSRPASHHQAPDGGGSNRSAANSATGSGVNSGATSGRNAGGNAGGNGGRSPERSGGGKSASANARPEEAQDRQGRSRRRPRRRSRRPAGTPAPAPTGGPRTQDQPRTAPTGTGKPGTGTSGTVTSGTRPSGGRTSGADRSQTDQPRTERQRSEGSRGSQASAERGRAQQPRAGRSPAARDSAGRGNGRNGNRNANRSENRTENRAEGRSDNRRDTRSGARDGSTHGSRRDGSRTPSHRGPGQRTAHQRTAQRSGSPRGGSARQRADIAPADWAGSASEQPASHRRAERHATHQRSQARRARKRTRIPSRADAPFAALSIATSGIHPTTSRLIALSVVFLAPDPADPDVPLTAVESWTRHVNPGEDAGPWHLHGYSRKDLAEAPGFDSVAPSLRDALHGRQVLVHQCAYTWGFIEQEYRRLHRQVQRMNRGLNRGRNRQRSPKTVESPVPALLIDTLTTARMQAVDCFDFRLRAIAARYASEHPPLDYPEQALPDIGAAASDVRAEVDADQLLEADGQLVPALLRAQLAAERAGGGSIARIHPSELTQDKFGLARSETRVGAAEAPRTLLNPGVAPEDGPLVAGMEFVVSPDITTDPDVVIAQGVAAGLVYSEKLNRTTSLVVCNTNHEPRGKAMHAQRKGIPLLSDADFLERLEDVLPGERAPR